MRLQKDEGERRKVEQEESRGRKELEPGEVSDQRRDSGSILVPVSRGAVVEGEGGRVHIVCSNCAEVGLGRGSPLHR